LILALALILGALPAARAAVLSESDQRLYREAFALAKAGKWQDARRLATRGEDRLPALALEWADLTRSGTDASFAELTQFMQMHHDWPGQKALSQHAEEAIAPVPDGTLLAWFAQHPPATPAAQLRYADLLAAAGHESTALEMTRAAWIQGNFTSFEERTLLQRYHGMLRAEDHQKRLDRLLWDGQTEEAHRLLRLLNPEYQALGEARLALLALSPGVERLVARVPGALQRDPGLLYDRLRWRVRKEMYDSAVELLKDAPRDLVRPAAWATERNILVRHLYGDGKAPLAYELAEHHGLLAGPAFADLEFLAGWIALRSLHRPDLAYNHFVRLYDSVKMPVSVSRGAYWAGRAAEAMGYQQLAGAWYESAAEHMTSYYGQLAAAHLGTAPDMQDLREPQPTRDETAAFERRDMVHVARALNEVGAEDYERPFLRHLADIAQTPSEFALTARLAAALDRPDLAVSAAKKASYAGVTLLDEGWPVEKIPAEGPAETPLVLAMARQESAFDRDAVSQAGARGLMQLMPATASRIAKLLHIPFSAPRLTADTHYNITLGRAYLSSLIDDFSGSYVLAVAAYNAGPARVHEWMGMFGDPRSKSTDAIDWVESIPFNETRNYVQRVLENLQVYRFRLGDRRLAFSLSTDLKR
jgi:soluble lytic murein transglycosylase